MTSLPLSNTLVTEAEPAPAAHVAPAARAALLRFAHMSVSASLRHDYFSNGKGHQQSKALVSGGPAKAARSQPVPAEAGEPNGEEPAPHADADEPPSDAAAAGPDIAARYLAEVAGRRRLNSSEEYHLANLAVEGDQRARRRLIEHHLGLVVMMARRYVARGLPLLDLIEEGNLGLITASTKFDPELGYRFSTYAKWWIRQAIELALMTQSRLVRVPIHLSRSAKQAARLQKNSQRTEAGTAAEPGAPAAGLGADLVALLDDDDRDGGQDIDELHAGDETSPEACLSRGERRGQLMRVLVQLSSKERCVIEGRYGLHRGEPRTLDDIARELCLSCERVRQIEKEVLGKLRGLFAEHGVAADTLL
jgi:RNA polymerase nonessential primary-like sigma factor